MRILLIGEFSRLHNSLKEGLVSLGHEVIIVANGDGFKNYPADISTKAKWCESKLGNIARQIVFKLFQFDLARIEFGIRFYLYLKQLKNFDVVQLINELPIQTVPFFERYLLTKIFKQNKNVFLLSCSVDYLFARHLMAKEERYSIMNPYFENTLAKKEYRYIFEFLTKGHEKTHHLIYKNCKGVIASDIDYVNPIKNEPKFLGLIPNPINCNIITYKTPEIEDKIIIFLGINKGTYHTKGITYFEQALTIIKTKFSTKVEIIITESIPYNEYINLYNKAHILLDQVYAYDQGYNALEAMAKGKVVFTGAETEFENHYKFSEKVAINALPDVVYLVQKLSFLIENPEEIMAIGKRARAFIENEHDYKKIAGKYLEVWKAN